MTVKRKHIRFKPDPGTIAWIDSATSGDFNPEVPALVKEEAAKGAGLVVVDAPHLQKDQECRVQIGKLSPIRAVVRWVKALDSQVSTLGLEYLD